MAAEIALQRRARRPVEKLRYGIRLGSFPEDEFQFVDVTG
jgi:hypothetical protein